jgi:hypothetical protein
MTTRTSDDFEDTDSICLACLADEHLRRLSQSRSQQSECCVCESAGVPSIQIADLAGIVDETLRRYFTWGAEVQKFRDENDDSGWTMRRGYEMSELLQVVLPENFPIHSTLQRVIAESDPSYDPRGGGEPFWSDEMRYQEMQPTLEEERAEWDRVAEELKFQRRFFNRRAEQFFGWLFEGLEDLMAPEGGVVLDFQAGKPLYRGRRCDSWADVQRIAADPSKELGPPPAANAAGVPVFYGALGRETCVAELRAPLGGQLAIAQFSLTRNVQLLDFRRLARARSTNHPSYFREDYAQQIGRLRFTAAVHQLIRTPIVPGRESDYLITQAMAEYLAHVCARRFDGLLFASAQDEAGMNVVLFDPTSLIQYVSRGMTFHEITRVKYSAKDLQLVNVEGKPGFLLDPMAIYDER